MENRIREYEKFIAKAKPSRELAGYHAEMVRNFQHERLVHLFIMLFVIFLTMVATVGTIVLSLVAKCDWLALLPFYIMTGILMVLSLAYIKHYYFLENHIQKLYNYSKKLRKL